MRKAKLPASVKADDKNTLKVLKDPAQCEEAEIAGLALDGVAANALTARTFASGSFGTLDLTECVNVLRTRAGSTHAGDLKHAETVLTAQAATLDAIFNELARRAALNMGEYLDATERYLRLALKAQGQCRATLETLAAIKNPPMVFAKQANIAHGPQQVNNGTPAHAGKTQTQQNELLERQHGKSLDFGAQAAAGRIDPAMATMEAKHRTADSRG